MPVINAIPAIEAELVNRGLRRVGILGTRVVMRSRLYGGVNAVDVVAPQGESFDATHNAYIAMAAAGQVNDQQRELLFSLFSPMEIGVNTCNPSFVAAHERAVGFAEKVERILVIFPTGIVGSDIRRE